MRSYVYKCDTCKDTFEAIVNFDERETTPCPICETVCVRAWTGWSPNMSTRNSASMPSAVGKGRFDKLREQQSLKKEKAHARETGDATTEKKINREVKKL